MDDLLADFVAETREMLEAVGGEIVAWEADPADRARLDAIFRFVHTVKGNCGFFDFPRLEKLSHAAEDALAECRGGRREPDSGLVSGVLAIVDRIGEMTDAIEAGEDYPEGGDEELVAALSASASTAAMEPVAASPPYDAGSPGASGADGTKPGKTALQRTIRLPVSLLDEVMKGVSDMVLARNDLARRLREAGEQPTIDGPFERLSSILADVRTGITRMRMQRLEYLFGSIPRLVRDLSAELGKQVMVDFEGGDVELDREMIEMVRDPLTHIIRNAIDHGIEAPTDRLKSGKREIGLLRFTARQSGNRISLIITDDGKGVAGDRLAAKAVAAGLYSEAEVAAFSERQKLLLMFEPGLSTADSVSSVSGRGVGMDVVRANIEKVGGSIDVSSRPGEGTSFYLQLPLTLSIISALTVEVAGQLYAIPRSYVEEVALASVQGIEFARAGERKLITFRDRRVPCIALADVFGLSEADRISWGRMTLILVRLASDDVFALGVDRVHDHEDVVVKPVAPAVMATGLYGGTTLLDDGRPIMLLDIPSIASQRGLDNEIKNRSGAEDEPILEEEKSAVPVMLFKGLDGRKRAFRLEMVRRIDTIEREAIDVDGASAKAIIDGQIFDLAGHDTGPLPEGRCRLLRLSDGERELTYVVSEVLDAAAITEEVTPELDDPAIEGVTLIQGGLVPIMDGFRLFASRPSKPRSQSNPVCRLPQNNEWSRTILEPLVRAAGYSVIAEKSVEADVAILVDEFESESAGPARATIRLTSKQDAAAEGAIYRYDREALLGALRQACKGAA
ncbi:chemotaxis protein CheA [Qipengyuania sp.]|uniref:chemotaxis protein CheA n=1 Tax=Qipengyuania sp. TaxID=2004515 RepID=UPI0035C86C7A